MHTTAIQTRQKDAVSTCGEPASHNQLEHFTKDDPTRIAGSDELETRHTRSVIASEVTDLRGERLYGVAKKWQRFPREGRNRRSLEGTGRLTRFTA